MAPPNYVAPSSAHGAQFGSSAPFMPDQLQQTAHQTSTHGGSASLVGGSAPWVVRTEKAVEAAEALLGSYSCSPVSHSSVAAGPPRMMGGGINMSHTGEQPKRTGEQLLPPPHGCGGFGLPGGASRLPGGDRVVVPGGYVVVLPGSSTTAAAPLPGGLNSAAPLSAGGPPTIGCASTAAAPPAPTWTALWSNNSSHGNLHNQQFLSTANVVDPQLGTRGIAGPLGANVGTTPQEQSWFSGGMTGPNGIEQNRYGTKLLSSRTGTIMWSCDHCESFEQINVSLVFSVMTEARFNAPFV